MGFLMSRTGGEQKELQAPGLRLSPLHCPCHETHSTFSLKCLRRSDVGLLLPARQTYLAQLLNLFFGDGGLLLQSGEHPLLLLELLGRGLGLGCGLEWCRGRGWGVQVSEPL